jgi:hypothetical protein
VTNSARFRDELHGLIGRFRGQTPNAPKLDVGSEL